MSNQVSFAIGTGRCGTHFLDRIIQLEKGVASHHERHRVSDAFFRYCRWYGLAVDNAGFCDIKKRGVAYDLAHNSHSFEASAFLSFSIPELYELFHCKFILMLRRPDNMVNSYIRKGWYSKKLIRSDSSMAPGYQPGLLRSHHSFSRIVPIGDEASRWDGYTQVGKLAWYWKALNLKVLELAGQLPDNCLTVQKLENLDYTRYQQLTQFLGFESNLGNEEYTAVVRAKPGTLNPSKTIHDWTDQEIQEFEYEVEEAAKEFGYEWRVDKLRELVSKRKGNGDSITEPSSGYYARTLRKWLNKLSG